MMLNDLECYFSLSKSLNPIHYRENEAWLLVVISLYWILSL